MQKKVNLKMISVSTILLICTVIGTIFVLHKSPETEKSLTIHFKWNESAPYLYYETEDGEDSTGQCYSTYVCKRCKTKHLFLECIAG